MASMKIARARSRSAFMASPFQRPVTISCEIAGRSVRKKGEIRTLASLPRLELQPQTRPCVGPVFVGRRSGDAEDLRRFFDGQAREIAQLNEPGRLGVFRGEFL